MRARARLEKAERSLPPSLSESERAAESEREAEDRRHRELVTRFLCSLDARLIEAWAYAKQNATERTDTLDQYLYGLGQHIALEADWRAHRVAERGGALLPEADDTMAHPRSSYPWRDERWAFVSEQEAERRYQEATAEVRRRRARRARA